MNKKKEIEEMAKVIKKASKPIEYDEGTYTVTTYPTEEDIAAELIFNAGYRKADEVQKKMARDILEYIKNTFEGDKEPKGEFRVGVRFVINYLKNNLKQYGVEVD